jgi:hypothetical protein
VEKGAASALGSAMGFFAGPVKIFLLDFLLLIMLSLIPFLFFLFYLSQYGFFNSKRKRKMIKFDDLLIFLIFLDDSSFDESVQSGIADDLWMERCNARAECE